MKLLHLLFGRSGNQRVADIAYNQLILVVMLPQDELVGDHNRRSVVNPPKRELKFDFVWVRHDSSIRFRRGFRQEGISLPIT